MGKLKPDINADRSATMRSTTADNYYTLLGIEREERPSQKYKMGLLLFLLILAMGCLTAVIVTLVKYKPYVDPDGEDFDMFTLESSEVLSNKLSFTLKSIFPEVQKNILQADLSDEAN